MKGNINVMIPDIYLDKFYEGEISVREIMELFKCTEKTVMKRLVGYEHVIIKGKF